MDLSSVLPIAFEEQAIHVFLKDKCGLQEYFLCYDYCYSNDWLEQVAKEFKPKIIHNIFFKKTEPKGGRDQKKKGRKEKVELVTE